MQDRRKNKKGMRHRTHFHVRVTRRHKSGKIFQLFPEKRFPQSVTVTKLRPLV